MKPLIPALTLISLIFLSTNCNTPHSQKVTGYMISFTKKPAHNPVLTPESNTGFFCPVRHDTVRWEEKDVFNPATVVRGDTIFLIYRAEDPVGKYAGTSRIGLAYSFDCYSFKREKEPVLYPDNDDQMKYEWEGGCEDPRVVEDENGTYYMTYTAYDGDKARLMIATSFNLRKWTKHGPVFFKEGDKYVNMWSKSGSIVCREENGRLIATRIKGKYWMYWGDSNIYIATSDNLIDWVPLREEDQLKNMTDTINNYDVAFKRLISPRQGFFDSQLVEPGPPAVMTERGILLIYNSKNHPTAGDTLLAKGTYAAGQVLIDSNDPMLVLNRADKWFLAPDQDFEITGQVNNVCFAEGLSFFKNRWLLYYGTADSKIAVAESLK